MAEVDEKAIRQVSSDLLEYYISACLKEARNRGYRHTELDKLQMVLVVARNNIPWEYYVNPPHVPDPEYPDEESEGQSS